jgi:short-subunit dehydrogenase
MRGQGAVSARNGEVAVVTGGTAGVGRAVAIGLGRLGHPVGLLARDADGLEHTRREVEEMGGRAMAVSADVAESEQVEAAAKRIEAELGPIGIWVNNAMVTVFSPFASMSAEEFERVTRVTYLGVVNGTRAALARMRPRDAGVIVQIGSALAYQAIPLQSAYCGAKFAARGFTDAARAELIQARSRVSITTVHLPAVNTPQFVWARSRLVGEPRPLAPIFEPETAADSVLFAIRHRWREVHLGHSCALTVLGSRFLPALLERHLATAAFDGQQGKNPQAGERAGNLFAPVGGLHALRGPFGNEAGRNALPFWLTTYPLVSLAATLLVILVVALALVALIAGTA